MKKVVLAVLAALVGIGAVIASVAVYKNREY